MWGSQYVRLDMKQSLCVSHQTNSIDALGITALIVCPMRPFEQYAQALLTVLFDYFDVEGTLYAVFYLFFF